MAAEKSQAKLSSVEGILNRIGTRKAELDAELAKAQLADGNASTATATAKDYLDEANEALNPAQ